MINDMDGVYTRTQAYNFLKNLLGVSKNVLLNKNFFCLFFKESDGMFLIKTSEDIIKSIFTKEGIAELNNLYYCKKQEKNSAEAEKISQKVMQIVKKSLAA